MQGNLNEIDIRSILQLVELGQRTGELFVEAYPAGATRVSGSGVTIAKEVRGIRSAIAQSWFVFFLNGQIVYAGETDSGLGRIRDHLRRLRIEPDLDQRQMSAIATMNAPEYGYLWQLLEHHILTPAQGRNILESLVNETLFDLLSIHQGSFIFEVGSALSPQLTTLEIGSLVAAIMKQIQEWKQFHPHIQSPDQCPVITDSDRLRQTLPENIFKQLERWADGKTSIRQIARYLNRDILMVARAIYPYTQQGLIQLSYLSSRISAGEVRRNVRKTAMMLVENTQPLKVICIDDGIAIGESVEFILGQHGYATRSVSNPVQALSQVFEFQPDLILCDIAMPELDGYELCAMFRQSTAFRQTPIIMLTGKEGFIDRVRARMVGATDYLTKPFGESELLTLVEKYIGLVPPDSMQSERLLADTL